MGASHLRSGCQARNAARARFDGALRNVSCCRREHEGLQLVRGPLGSKTTTHTSRKITRHNLLSITFMGAMACAPPTRGPNGGARPALDSLIPALLDSAGVPGLALATVSRGRIVWARGFGSRRQGETERIDTATVFEAASLGKPVFAYAVMKLVDEGRFDLDRPLASYQPLPDLSQDSRYQRITARMVLSHTSGLPNEVRPGEHLSLQFEPGTRFSYSGAGFAYLQRVIEGVVRTPLDTFVRRTVFEPLHMTNSAYRWE